MSFVEVTYVKFLNPNIISDTLAFSFCQPSYQFAGEGNTE